MTSKKITRVMETIDQKLDRLFPAHCYNCNTLVLRAVKPSLICPKCGLDQVSPEASGILRHKQQLIND